VARARLVTGPVHLGRLWTNGEPYLALDSIHVPAWRGFTDDTYNTLVVPLPYTESAVTFEAGRAGVVGTDGVVGDEGWLEVFRTAPNQIVVVQASGRWPYRDLLVACLAHPADDDDRDGGVFEVTSGYLVILNAAMDGTGQYSGELRPAVAGEIPGDVADRSGAADLAGLIIEAEPGSYHVITRWFTALDDENSFARWTLRHDG